MKWSQSKRKPLFFRNSAMCPEGNMGKWGETRVVGHLNPWLLYEAWCYTVDRNVGSLARKRITVGMQDKRWSSSETSSREILDVYRICFDAALCSGEAKCEILLLTLATARGSNRLPSASLFDAPWRRRNSRLCLVDGTQLRLLQTVC